MGSELVAKRAERIPDRAARIAPELGDAPPEVSMLLHDDVRLSRACDQERNEQHLLFVLEVTSESALELGPKTVGGTRAALAGADYAAQKRLEPGVVQHGPIWRW